MDTTPAIPLAPCCPQGGGGDAVALLVILGILFMGHGLIQLVRRRKGNPEMKNWKQGLFVGALMLALGSVMLMRQDQSQAEPAVSSDVMGPAAAIEAGLPALLELGADRCVPCQQMKPIIEAIQSTYEGQLHVEFIDVWKNPDEGRKYGVRVIPLQIFFDATGKELFRHEGFFSKEDILAKWRELGVELQ